MGFPKAAPVIREKTPKPVPARRVRADGTEEICVEDILVIVPKAAPPRPKLPSPEELGDADIVVEEAEPEFRRPAYSIHATQEILADDVIEVTAAAVRAAPEPPPSPPPHREEIPSTAPCAIDAADDLDFPSPPQYSGPYPSASGPARITNYSATQVFRRRSANVKVVIASMSIAAALVLVAGLARISPAAGSEGPVGIAMHAPKKLDPQVRGFALAYGSAPRIQAAETVSIDALPTVHHRRHHYR